MMHCRRYNPSALGWATASLICWPVGCTPPSQIQPLRAGLGNVTSDAGTRPGGAVADTIPPRWVGQLLSVSMLLPFSAVADTPPPRWVGQLPGGAAALFHRDVADTTPPRWVGQHAAAALVRLLLNPSQIQPL